ncbi:3-mercaptopyruvate sulfurtransferase [Pigmentiphaga humi]|uniref:3-mercaptopyruvate sulfurtransferase n=1 Tax=Pigmentiphaga humi TaxID=2478468 RepID=A0A3P4B7K2_9BURK|nr:rhodanese-like domain-containing protein [Pigmentiphaga humi]VCU71921.1 3-mercaptopyruvate sulfurtransferase [Pigmentiphaga humi]
MSTVHAAAVSPFISAEALAARLEAGEAAVVYVAREPGAAPSTLIPGSVRTAVPTHYADPGDPARGQLPLPTQDAVRRWAAEASLDRAREIVVYDDTTGTAAARAWWVLTWAGLEGVRILDGGLRAWTEKVDAEAESGPAVPAALPALSAIDTEAIAAQPAGYRLFDARSRSAYDGDGVAPSHLPGALSSPAAVWQDADGRLLPIDRRRAVARALGLLDENERPVVAYCGSGGAAAYWIAAVQDLGVQASLYAGSWSAWSSDSARLAAHAG